jgi:SAM-dependent methyltransferase
MPDQDPRTRSAAFTSESVPDTYERLLVPAVFEPWADVLLDSVGIASESRVLDVASGTGVVARAAAQRAGARGHVVASDVSDAMLARSSTLGKPAGAAEIEYCQASSDALPFGDGSFDVVLCQQGLQFFPEQPRAVAEMRRVLHPGGVAGISVWAAGHPVQPFGVYGDELAAVGAPPPFPGAFDSGSFTMGLESIRFLLEQAGFTDVEAQVVELELSWPDAALAAAGVMGTPFGPVVRALPDDRRSRYEATLAERFAPEEPGAPVRRRTAAVLARAVAP